MSPQPDLHVVAADLPSGWGAAVLLQRLFDMVAIAVWKVAPVDPFQAVIKGELIVWDQAEAEPGPHACLKWVLQLEALVPLVAGFLIFCCQERTLARLIAQSSAFPYAVTISLNPITIDLVNLNDEEAPVAGGIPEEVVSVAGADHD